MNLFILAVLFCSATAAVVHGDEFDDDDDFSFREESLHPPIYQSDYKIVGVRITPTNYGGIKKPFTLWLSSRRGKSRTDYYHGVSTTIIRRDDGPFGSAYKIMPITTETQYNVKSCVAIHGRPRHPYRPQTAIPSLVNIFRKSGEIQCGNEKCNIWSFSYKMLGRIYLYDYYVTQGPHPKPVRFRKRCYDILLHRYYSYYTIEIKSFQLGTIPDSIFDLNGTHCGGFPKHQLQLFDADIEDFPLQTQPSLSELYNDPSGNLFSQFILQHNKKYHSWFERRHREINFLNNVQYINDVNQQGKSYTLAINPMADMTEKELTNMRGRLRRFYHATKNYIPWKYDPHEKPLESIDWRKKGAVTPIKYQAHCGSCFAFSAVTPIESALFRQTGRLIPLSEQSIIDCSWGYGNYACNGGMEYAAYQFVTKHGIPSAKCYGPYLASPGYCHLLNCTHRVRLDGYSIVLPSGNVSAVRLAVSKIGPISIAFNVHSLSFHFYSSGIFEDPTCYNDIHHINHALNLVGYGKLGNEHYWIIRNSWSEHWGENGYMRMKSTNANECAVATFATFPVLKKDGI
ncbi:uncharacterized protein TRIADDRAFT_19901 [Trichoplax adhaerens]|uniref:Peptidase C1A papain C-terminal domain-containing protein n=1 Tax=Trichoplax adhaerens TaxID=10228 RepID=B3RJ94_TRIAD|nr:hypothetical protein TRIADDRAFT_19901 [Trichoplax adhaerens]EDV28494.1 hypothetical protein TRIADDRAFT_19901 [Trichoplax adhaerens]|eukprot:XP_002107696.1 hypothetical protein TRIADDRAFT_19901 [Trichoplax adhaerens]